MGLLGVKVNEDVSKLLRRVEVPGDPDRVKKINCFPAGDDGGPIKGEVDSEELKSLRQELATFLDENDIDFSKKFPDFNPHITLSYADEEIAEKTLSKPIEWVISELILWPAKFGDQGMTVHLPLGKGEDLISMANIFQQLSQDES